MEDHPMKPVQFRPLVLSLALLLLVPFGSALAKSSRSAGAVTVPLEGTVVDAANQPIGRFSGDVTINRFARQNQQLVAVTSVTGTVTNLAGQVLKSGVQTPVVLPVTNIGSRSALAFATPPATGPRMMPASFTRVTSGRLILAQAQTCGILHLDIGGTTVNLLGFIVNLSPITLDISGDSAGPLGALVCEIVALLGTAADIVGLLNQVLGLLTGLLGGLVGGLGI
jgi:hypothetical protein